MEKNIIQKLINEDKKAREKIENLKKKHEIFLSQLSELKKKNEKKHQKKYDLEIEAIENKFKQQLEALTIRLNQHGQSDSEKIASLDKKEIEQLISKLFNKIKQG
ncbi:MAG: hypothetical protein ACO207_03435 [Bacilli bacterium]